MENVVMTEESFSRYIIEIECNAESMRSCRWNVYIHRRNVSDGECVCVCNYCDKKLTDVPLAQFGECIEAIIDERWANSASELMLQFGRVSAYSIVGPQVSYIPPLAE